MTEIDDAKEKAFAPIKKSVARSSEDWQSQLVEKYQNLKNVSSDIPSRFVGFIRV